MAHSGWNTDNNNNIAGSYTDRLQTSGLDSLYNRRRAVA